MKPLSEQALREKVTKLLWGGRTDVEGVVDLILSDRKAYGEQLLTEAIQVVLKSNSIDVYDNMKKLRERQRNQGEKTDG